MKLYKIAGILLLFAVSLASCRKYVEDVPVQGQRVLVYTVDYRLLMNNRTTFENASGLSAILGSDDADITAPEVQTNLLANSVSTAMYIWRKPFQTGEISDQDWVAMYAGMYVSNTVIEGVMSSESGTDLLKKTILGEALVQRAFSYFTLVNMYGKQYDAATSATDPGVPLLLQAKLFTDLTRASVSQVYSQVIKDVNQAIPLLPVTQNSTAQPFRATAYALMAKVYLNMRDFAKAGLYADSSLTLSSQLYDYKTSTSTFPSQYTDKQILLRKVPVAVFTPMQLSQSLLNLLGTKDLRYVLFVRPGTGVSPSFTGFSFWSRERYSGGVDKPAVGLSVNDTWLIKAECLARTGKRDDAVKMLNDLRKLRFTAADYVALTAATDQEALQLVIDERRREFFGTGLRWFDQRRLNKDPLFAKTVTRVIGGNTYTLEPNSNGYVFPLAPLIVSQNPELVQNPN